MNDLIAAAYDFYQHDDIPSLGMCAFDCKDRKTKEFITNTAVFNTCQYHYDKLVLLTAIRKRDYVTIQNLAPSDSERICCVCDKMLGLHDTDSLINIPLSEDSNEQSTINVCETCRGIMYDVDDLEFSNNVLCDNCGHFFQVDKQLHYDLKDRAKKFKQSGVETQTFCSECLSGIYTDLHDRRKVVNCQTKDCCYGGSKVVDYLQFPPTCPCNKVYIVNDKALEYVEIQKLDDGYVGYYNRGANTLYTSWKDKASEVLNDIITTNKE